MTIHFAIVVSTILCSFYPVYGGNSAVTCSIVTDNTFNYTCSAMGILTTVEMKSIAATDFACAQTSISGISETNQTAILNFTADSMIGCSDISSDYVIQCIAFAGVGAVGGACTQMISSDDEVCDFKEDPDGNFVWLPQVIGNDCIGKQTCNITSNYNGFMYDGMTYDLRTKTTSEQNTNLETCCSNSTELKFKFVALCGPPILPNTICININNFTTTMSPSSEPTLEPTFEPTFEPTLEPIVTEDNIEMDTDVIEANIEIFNDITFNTTNISLITGEYYLTNGEYIKPKCNGNNEIYIHWMNDRWQIEMNKSNNEYIAKCEVSQLNGSSPVKCDNYVMEDETNSFILISNGRCAINECDATSDESIDYIFWGIIGCIVFFFVCCVICVLSVLIWYRNKKQNDEITSDSDTDNIDRIVIDEDEDKVLIMKPKQVENRMD
eukprot:84900_1